MPLLLNRTGVVSSSAHPATPAGNPDIAYLMSCIASDGAIRETPGDINVRPYMSHYGCIGLARAYEISADPAHLAACWGWVNWYAAHMDPTTGYVNDYHAASAAPAVDWVDSGAADSTDAYAGMFLMATWATFVASGFDTATLTPLLPALNLAVTAITSTQQVYGLTWALPTYQQAYLEDNIETLAGLTAANNLIYYAGGDTTSANAAQDLLFRSFGYFYNEQTGVFDWALDSLDVFTRNDWSNENSQRQQVWALGWGALPPSGSEAADLLAAYVAALPDWSTRTDRFEVMPTWAAFRLTNNTMFNDGINNLVASGNSTGRAYPWTCAISGQIVAVQAGFSAALSAVSAVFPDGTNLLDFDGRDPAFYLDSDSDGRGDFVFNYGSPTMTLLTDPDGPTGSHIQQMASVSGGEDMRWDPVDFLVDPDKFYLFSFDRKVTDLASGGQVVIKMEMMAADDSGTGYGYDVHNTVDSDWVRWSLHIRTTSTTQKIRCVIGIDGGGTVQVRQPKLERAAAGPTNWVYPGPPPVLAVVDHYADVGNGLPISTASGTLTWDNTGFDAASELGTAIGHDGWVSFTPTDNCTGTFDTFGSGPQVGGGNADTHLRIYQQMDTLASSINGLLLVAENDDDNNAHSGAGTDGANSWLQVSLQAGLTYYVQVGGHSTHPPSTNMVLHWSGLEFTTVGATHPRNDNLLQVGFTPGQALTISGVDQDVPFSNWDYAAESFETGAHMFRSAWYTFVPGSTGTATLDTSLVAITGHIITADGSGSTTDTYLRLYTSAGLVTAFTDLTQVATDDDSGGGAGQSLISYAVTAGQRYYVQASMYSATYWNDRFALRWNIP